MCQAAGPTLYETEHDAPDRPRRRVSRLLRSSSSSPAMARPDAVEMVDDGSVREDMEKGGGSCRGWVRY